MMKLFQSLSRKLVFSASPPLDTVAPQQLQPNLQLTFINGVEKRALKPKILNFNKAKKRQPVLLQISTRDEIAALKTLTLD